MHEQMTLEPASIEERPLLRNLLELYRYDFSEVTGDDVDERGLFGFRPLDAYWCETDRHPFLIRIDGKPAGFALVNEDDGTTCIKVFFVMRKYRRRGIGRQAAGMIFARYPGRWRVEHDARNRPAHAFWRAIVTEATGGNYQEMPASPKNGAARLAFEFEKEA